MTERLLNQAAYWNREVAAFDAIYSHRKTRFENWLDQTFRWDMYARFDYTMAHAEPIAGRAFLDVGCGTGRYAVEFARRGARQVVGIDISEEMIHESEKRALHASVMDRCAFTKSDFLSYESSTRFDVCIAIGLFDYIREPLPVLLKMRSVVTDRAVISMPRQWTWRAPVRKVRLGLRGCDVYFYSVARTIELLRQAGFRRYEVERVGQLHCVTAFVSA
jgi:2-polyprenyl-3-methyl-5-hydroxy-6-metoxy-1,4-benzoquinol methylase